MFFALLTLLPGRPFRRTLLRRSFLRSCLRGFLRSRKIELEDGYAVSRERVGEGVFPSVTFRMFRWEYWLLLASAEEPILVEYLRVIAFVRNADPVVRAIHRSKVTYEEQVLLAVRRDAHEAEDAAVAVVGVDPLETVPGIVVLVHTGVLPVEVQQAGVEGLQTLVAGVL